MAGAKYDAFLSHNSDDKPAVEQIARRLEQEGIRCWLDKWCLVPGEPWEPAAEQALRECRSCVVFFGASPVGPWHHEEMRLAMSHQVKDRSRSYRVILVRLPGASPPERAMLPGFLHGRTRVDFSDSLDDEDAIHRLTCGIRGIAPGPGPGAAIFEGQCPYPGLEPFTEDQTRFFFGRQSQVQWLLDKLREGLRTEAGVRFLAIVGASGSGKSSLALAGLIPALRAGREVESGDWPVVVTRPGNAPHESLAIALARNPSLAAAAGDSLTLSDRLVEDSRRLHHTIAAALHGGPTSQRGVILVDQFEETFTQCENEAYRRAFVENLLHAATTPGGKAIVLLTMRADFYGHCAAYPGLAAAVADHQDLVPPLSRVQLREVIERPAQLCGGEAESGLIHALIDEIEGQTGALPLLQHALRELWYQRDGRRLTYEAYEALGRLRGALQRRADEVYAEFPPLKQELCRRIFIRLTQLGRAIEDTKRRVSIDELLAIGDDPQAVEEVLQRLAERRLLTLTSQDEQDAARSVEVAHEALIRCWQRLRDWIDSRRESLILLEQLRDDARRWSENQRDVSFLYYGLPLKRAEELARDPEIDLSPLQREFLDASVRQLVDQLVAAETNRVLALSADLQPYIQRARDYLQQQCRQHADDSRQRLHAALALLPTDQEQLPFLRDRMLDASLEELFVVAGALREYREQLVPGLWEECRREDALSMRRLHAALALTMYDPPVDESSWERWQPCADELADWLVDAVAMNPSHYSPLLEALRPVRDLLLPPLARIYRAEDDRRQDWATSLLADYATDKPEFLGDIVLESKPDQFSVLLERLRSHGNRAVEPARIELARDLAEPTTEEEKEVLAKRQANAAALLLKLEKEDDAWPAFRHAPDPRARSYLIHRLVPLNVSPQVLITRLEHEGDVSACRALLLSLGEYDPQQIPEDNRQAFLASLAQIYREHPDPGFHAAAGWLLQRWGQAERIAQLRTSLRETEEHLYKRRADQQHRWYLTSQDHTMVVIEGGEFMMGSLESDPDRQPDEKLHRKRIDRRFALAAAAVTRAQYRAFQNESAHAELDLADHEQITAVIRTEDSPITGVTWYEAAAYCNWLSEKEGIPADQWCYEPNAERKFGPGMRAKANYLALTGYRLPSEAEWEYACRAGAVTRRFYGHSDDLLAAYACYMDNSGGCSSPVGRFKPNDLGLFDMHGNVWVWCHNAYSQYGDGESDAEDRREAGSGEGRVLRGGSFVSTARGVRAALRSANQPDSRLNNDGFRPARTYP